MANSVSRQLLIDEAKRRGWKTDVVGMFGMFLKITDERGHSELLRGTLASRTSAIGRSISTHKHLSMNFAEDQGFEVIPYCVPTNMEEALAFMFEHRSIVVKPDDAEQSQGVSVNVRNAAGLIKAMDRARGYSKSSTIILQPYLWGNLYRLVVLNGKFIAGIHRKAAEVVGDGSSTVRELIEQANNDPRRGVDSSSILKKIPFSGAIDLLGKDGARAIPAKGEVVRVNAIDSVSAGGQAINVTEKVHESWRNAMVKLTLAAGIFMSGFDVICEDISKPMPTPLPLLEMNSMPGLKLLHYPTAGGEAINGAAMLLDELFA